MIEPHSSLPFQSIESNEVNNRLNNYNSLERDAKKKDLFSSSLPKLHLNFNR